MSPAPHPLAGKPLELADTLRSAMPGRSAWARRLAWPIARRTFDIVSRAIWRPTPSGASPGGGRCPRCRLRKGSGWRSPQAILRYLGQGTPWLPADRLAQAQVSSWLSFEQTQHMHAFAQPRLLIHLRRTARVDDPAMQAWREIGMKAAAWMDAHLAGRDYLVGTAPTIADIALYPYTSMAAEGGYDLSGFAHIDAWLARMRALPGFTPLIATA